jgi:hypothetical protein
VTSEEEVLSHVARLLEVLGIPYMITGSVASSFDGRPRTTHDADFVIDPGPEALDRLVEELSAADFYVDGATARDALRGRLQFNVIDTASAFKLELEWVKKGGGSERQLADVRGIVDVKGDELDRRCPGPLAPGDPPAQASPGMTTAIG